jgi:excisionase family DNA binding protein
MEETTKRYLEQLDSRLAYSVAEAAELIGISERRMWGRVRAGVIKSFRDGQRRLISRRAVEEYLAARRSRRARVRGSAAAAAIRSSGPVAPGGTTRDDRIGYIPSLVALGRGRRAAGDRPRAPA